MTISFFKKSAFALGVLLLVPLQGASAATFPGQNARIAFGSATDQLQTVRPDGTKLKTLGASNAQDIAWSPSGTQLVFTQADQHGAMHLVSIDSHTGKARTIAHQPGSAESTPSWSYDGSSIAFTRTKSGKSAVFTVAVRSGVEKNISGWSSSGVSYRAPSWSPDNTSLVYEEFSASAARLLIQNLTNSQTRELVELSDITESARPQWSPSGKKILFNDSVGQVYTIWTDGSHRSVISDGDSYDAVWSPDGTRIAFLEDFSGEYVSVSQADGSIQYTPLALAGYSSVDAPVWSPDGTKLVFSASRAGTNKKDLFTTTVSSAPVITKIATNVSGQAAWQARPANSQ